MIQRLLPFVTLIVLFVGLSLATPHFLTETNLSSVVRQTAVINIMALGMTLVIVSGGIDLSVGSILAMAGLLGTMAIAKGYPIPVGVAAGIAVGRLLGPRQRLADHPAEDQPVHRHPGHAGDRARADADHFERPAGARAAGEVLLPGRRQPARRAVRVVDSAGLRACWCT